MPACTSRSAARSGPCSTRAVSPSPSSRAGHRSLWSTTVRRPRHVSLAARPNGRRQRSPTASGTPMPTEILMPALSPTMEEGKLSKWLIKEGQMIKAGDVIAEIETDKATMEVEATDEGKVGQLLVAEGTEGVKVNTPIATLLGEGESPGAAAL